MDQEKHEVQAKALNAIKYLGEKGLLDEAAKEVADAEEVAEA